MIVHCAYDQLIGIDELKLHPKNRNEHPPEQIERLAKVLKYQGWRYAVNVSNQTGLVNSGHGRILAAKLNGWTHVPVKYQDFENEDQEYASLIADNAIASWAELDLAGVNFDIPALGPDFEIDMLGIENFVIEPIDKLAPGSDEDETPEVPKESVVKLGDLFQLRNHRLLCGDSTSIDAVEKLMDGKKADMVFTDPPYNTGMSAKSASTRLKHMFNDDFTDDEWQNLLSSFCSNYWLSMKDNSVAYICLDWRRSYELIPHIKKHFKFSNLIIWDKIVHGLGSDYKYTHEFIHVCKKGDPDLKTNHGNEDYKDIWHIQRKMGRDEDHATKKPIEIIERSLAHASKNNDIILDLFGGSGSTLIACEKTNRKCFMMELDPHYCSVIIERWQKYSNKKAFLINEDGTLKTAYEELKVNV